ncbi:hypothetical protein K443DRAFT_109993 [Laccaria amethystina LaAM-08-1]|uniref:Uncharacterized protein n=1 Tax=Laccaria amethystina LaAM-08-1 TaxID=1095629 RepID=A0A0C9X073_9AGAR|nr:hypothetical protein K443DRAFT_109993 [Laccaria amethystina LaAM-08-1]
MITGPGRVPIGPPAIAGNPWSRSEQKMWILGPTAGGQSGQKATKFETAQSQAPGQDRRDVKCPNISKSGKFRFDHVTPTSLSQPFDDLTTARSHM